MRALILLALFGSACASAPAPISYRAEDSSPRAAPAATQIAPRPRPDAPPPNWADGEGTPLSAYALQPDAAQPFDLAATPATHHVRAGQELLDIAELYQIPLRALIEQNGLDAPYTLREGQDLRLPPPRLHRVARGESFEDVARRYNVDLRSLALLNRMREPYEVREGDAVVLPAMARAAAPPIPAPTSAADSGAAVQARFTWPVRGEILSRFGAQTDGRRLDGVEIAAREGAPIGAAGEGDVVYAGSDLAAYGTLVLIRHADGYVTAYGYASRALVRVGQHVRAGEAVAEVGRIGEGPPRVLFQARRGAQAVDPLPLLGGARN